MARLEPGVYETLITGKIEQLLAELNPGLAASVGDLSDSGAADRLSLHVAGLIRGAIEVLNDRITHVTMPLDPIGVVPLRLHARYTRLEILAALGIGTGVKPMTWQTGVLWDETSKTDLFAFTLDKSRGAFSPTTRYRDYAISRELIHWESQSTTAEAGETGRRYIHHEENGTRILLFARLNVSDRAFWCLGPATYVSHQGERPIAFTWRLDHRLPADLYTSFAAAVA